MSKEQGKETAAGCLAAHVSGWLNHDDAEHYGDLRAAEERAKVLEEWQATDVGEWLEGFCLTPNGQITNELCERRMVHCRMNCKAGRTKALAMAKAQAPGFVVANGSKDRFRQMDQGCPVWVEDKYAALRFARREDAESFAAEDEDAWFILPVLAPKETP